MPARPRGHVLGAGICALAALVPAPALFWAIPPAAALSASVAPRNINASLVPEACTAACQPALAAQTTCAAAFACLCTDANAQAFAQCMDCVVGPAAVLGTLAQSAAAAVLSEYTAQCAQNGVPVASLTLSLASTSSFPSATSVDDAKSGGAARPVTTPLICISLVLVVVTAFGALEGVL
ncbi:hypothetical protein GGX14DRAFT_610909 [Mycena pura]|uniref:Uncharacterized protein n=1 Tax=Mycena pura TaxID=153505 RepID=A0AAD6VJ05_9AGAR|nr:hypothetical protein GGX14DRAFT_610909 [Mycena pura]